MNKNTDIKSMVVLLLLCVLGATANAGLQKPDSFDHYVAISPALWVSDHQLEKTAAELIGKNSYRGKTLHLSLANETRMGVYRFLEVLDRKDVQGIEWQFTHYGDENQLRRPARAARQPERDLRRLVSVRERDIRNGTGRCPGALQGANGCIRHQPAHTGVYEQLDNRRKAREYYQRAAALAERQNAGQWQMNILNAALVRTEA